MEFKILGPLEVWRGGARVEISGRHRPKLLAALVLDTGRVVTIPRLVEVLWGAHPPGTARRQVQNTMAALRRDLAQDGPSVIESTSDGYRIPREGNTVDAHAFSDLVAGARAARQRDDREESLRLLREALRLWRGDALAGMNSDAIEAAAGRLDEARLTAIEDRTQLELELPDRGPDIGELRELLERHPFRQRLAGHLMTALHRGGRTPEALEVFEHLQVRLNRDLGLDPEARLGELRTEILRDNAKNEAAAAPAPDPQVPAQLPADPGVFVGRRDHLSLLDELLDDGRTTAVISPSAGDGGTGKSALAVHWGNQVRQHFPDGQLYLDLRGYDGGEPVGPMDGLVRLFHALGQPASTIPANVDDAAAMYRSLLADRRMLVVLDNAREAAQVRPLLPGGTGNFALVTSRDSLASLIALDDAVPIRVDALGAKESRDLLAAVLGRARTDAAGDAVDEIARRCARLPLALRIAAAHLATHPARALAEAADRLAAPPEPGLSDAAGISTRPDRRLADAAEGLAVRTEAGSVDEPSRAVAAAFALAYSALDDGQRRLLAALGLVPGEDFAAGLAAAVSDMDQEGCARALDALVAAHLVDNFRPGRYRLHDLVREQAVLRAHDIMDGDRRDEVRRRFIDWHYRHRNRLPAAEGANVIAALDSWRGGTDTWRLAVTLSGFRTAEFRASELLRLARTELPAARDSGDSRGLGLLYISLATLLSYVGDNSQAVAFAEEAVRADPEDAEGHVRANLAIQLLRVGRYAEAEPMLRGAREAAAGNPGPYAYRTATLSNTLRILGRWDEAAALLDSLDSANPATVATLLPSAELNSDRGRDAEAAAAFDAAVALADADDDPRLRILTLTRRAAHLRRAGDPAAADRDLAAALSLAEQTGREVMSYEAHLVRAELLADTDPRAALAELDLLPQDDSPTADRELVAEIARIRCVAYLRVDEPALAVGVGERAVEIYEAMPCPLREARSLMSLAEARAKLADPAAAPARTRARALFSQLGSRESRVPGRPA